MTDTVRTVATLQGLLADGAAANGTTRQILRDMLVSLDNEVTVEAAARAAAITSATSTEVALRTAADAAEAVTRALYDANIGGINVKNAPYNAVGDNVTDDTAAFQAAAAAACAYAVANGTGCILRIPKGTYKITDTITINAHRVHVEGEGKWATSIVFTPTSAKPLWKFQMANTALVIYQCSVRRMTFTGGGTQQKIAIDLYDCSEFLLQELTTNSWTGTTSIALRTGGRELLYVDTVEFFADRPVHVTPNANSATLSADHFTFHNCYLAPQATTESSYLFDSTCGIANLTFSGYQSWVGGKYGIRGLSGGAVTALEVNVLAGRYEQPGDNTGFAIDWEIPTTNLNLLGVNLGGISTPTNGGLKLRNVTHSLLMGVEYTGSGGAATFLDMDSTCRDIRFIQCFPQDSSIVSMPGFEELEGYAGSNTLAPIKGNSFWILTSFGSPIVYQNGQPTHKTKTTIAVGAQFQLTMSSVKTGRLRVSAYSATGPVRACGSFHIDGTGSTVETDAHSNLAATNTGGKLCTIWSNASLINLINNLAQTVTVLIQEEWAT